MEYIELLSTVQKAGKFREISLNCCDPAVDSFSLIRAQLSGWLIYSDEGVRAADTESHDIKCEGLLRYAREENADLLLVPEYCISYHLLKKIIASQDLWPGNKKLWCLPCQGIPNREFEQFLSECRVNGQVFLCEEAWAERRVDRKKFVNALFYLFVAYNCENPNLKKLCLAFQLKTQHMADGCCECEVPGLTTGSIIYHLNNRLMTFLCADSLNNDIVWQDLQKQSLSNCIFLHPQLNEAPRNPDFRRVRQEMLRHNENGCYISCNWAQNTVLTRETENNTQQEHLISLSWSCIYRKFSGPNGFSGWAAKRDIHNQNGAFGLFSGYIKNANTEVWFSLSDEHALLLWLPSVTTHSYGNVSVKNICAKMRLCPCDKEPGCWNESPFSYSLMKRSEQIDDSHLQKRIQELEAPYRYPLDETEKYKTDRFFSLTLAGFHNEILEMNENEEPVAWTLLLEEKDIEEADLALLRIQALISLFNKQCFPRHMDIFNQKQRFTFIPSEQGIPNANLTAEERHIIVAYAENRRAAEKHVQFLLKNECHNNEDLLRNWVCVLCQEPDKPVMSLPKLSTNISRGEPVVMRRDVTNGDDGNE